jgi:hypothetical protein
MTTKQAIEAVLTGKRKPIRVPEIIKAGVPLATSLKGKTPGQVFYSALRRVEEGRRSGRPDRTGRVQAQLEAPEGGVKVSTVVLAIGWRGATVGSTHDEIEEETSAEAIERTLAAWRSVRPDCTFHLLLVVYDGHRRGPVRSPGRPSPVFLALPRGTPHDKPSGREYR